MQQLWCDYTFLPEASALVPNETSQGICRTKAEALQEFVRQLIEVD